MSDIQLFDSTATATHRSACLVPESGRAGTLSLGRRMGEPAWRRAESSSHRTAVRSLSRSATTASSAPGAAAAGWCRGCSPWPARPSCCGSAPRSATPTVSGPRGPRRPARAGRERRPRRMLDIPPDTFAGPTTRSPTPPSGSSTTCSTSLPGQPRFGPEFSARLGGVPGLQPRPSPTALAGACAGRRRRPRAVVQDYHLTLVPQDAGRAAAGHQDRAFLAHPVGAARLLPRAARRGRPRGAGGHPRRRPRRVPVPALGRRVRGLLRGRARRRGGPRARRDPLPRPRHRDRCPRARRRRRRAAGPGRAARRGGPGRGADPSWPATGS